jgi:lysophospholipase L1-like esterase
MARDIFDTLPRPDFMAIGDSLYNGVRSATIHGELAALSGPAQAAPFLCGPNGFVVPDYPRPVLMDLEEVLRELSLAELREGILANARAWQSASTWSSHACFDNLAFAGAAIEELFPAANGGITYAMNAPTIDLQIKALEANPKLDVAAAAKLWFAINTAFVLNPSRGKAMANLSALDIVARRKPKLLAISIGSNDGLFGAILPGGYHQKIGEIDKIPEKFTRLGAHLAKLPKEIEKIAVTNLIRPSAVANLSPRSDDEKRPGCGKYFKSYIPRIGDARAELPAADVAAFDKQIVRVNAESAKALKSADSRIVITDIHAMVDQYDFKHGCKPGYLAVKDGHSTYSLDNRVYRYSYLFGFLGGGLFGLDNMHPTAVGYSIMADALLTSFNKTERTDKQRAYDNDTLLQNPPRSIEVIQGLVGLLGSFGIFDGKR